jgi:hypothetical protein
LAGAVFFTGLATALTALAAGFPARDETGT